jgi:hypothetical protein
MSLPRPLLPPGVATLEAAIAADPVLARRCAVSDDGSVAVAACPGAKATAELILHLRERARAEGLPTPAVILAGESGNSGPKSRIDSTLRRAKYDGVHTAA